MMVQVTTMKLNGTHHHLVYADDVTTLGGSVYIIKKNREALVVASKETVRQVSTDKTKYMIVS